MTNRVSFGGVGTGALLEQLLDEGKYRPITEIAAVEGVDVGQASRIARLTRLAPWMELANVLDFLPRATGIYRDIIDVALSKRISIRLENA